MSVSVPEVAEDDIGLQLPLDVVQVGARVRGKLRVVAEHRVANRGAKVTLAP